MKKLLIVDDNEQNLRLLQILLEKHGYGVDMATNGDAALKKARLGPPDLVISDILMPVMDGYALCREWRKDTTLKTIPFIFYTATYVDATDESLAFKLGADGFIPKPVSTEKLLRTIRQVLENGAASRVCTETPSGDICLREYNEVLIRKLETMMERQRAILDMAENILLVLSPDRKILEFNPAAERLFGTTKAHVLGKDYRRLLDPIGGNPSLEKMFTNVLGGDIARDVEGAIQTKGTQKRILLWNMSRLTDTSGRAAGLVALGVDITERKAAESALKDSEEKYRTLVANVPGVIYRCACDPEWTMHYISDQIELITGFPAADFIRNHRRSFASIIHPKDDRRLREVVLAKVKTENPFEFDYRLVDNRGRDHWVHEKGQGIYSADGYLRYLDGVILDITELRQAQEDREKLIADLQKALSEVKTLGGLLPICASCKKIRDDMGYWNQIEAYIRDHSEAEFSHGICPECARRHYPDLYPPHRTGDTE